MPYLHIDECGGMANDKRLRNAAQTTLETMRPRADMVKVYKN